jgi:hypothetical protein
MKKILVVLIFIVVLFAGPALADNQIAVPVENLDFMRATLHSQYDCGVGAIVEVMAFWGQNGFPNLLQGGTFTGQSPDNGTAMQNLHQFFLKRENSGFDGSYTYPSSMPSYIAKYFQSSGYDVQVLRDTYVTWSEISAEIEAGRPVIMVGYGANHFFVVKGITQNPQTLTVLWGHVPEVRTYTRAQIIAMGPLEAFYIRPVAVDPPDDLPQEQAWWPEVSQWMGLNGWEMVRK